GSCGSWRRLPCLGLERDAQCDAEEPADQEEAAGREAVPEMLEKAGIEIDAQEDDAEAGRHAVLEPGAQHDLAQGRGGEDPNPEGRVDAVLDAEAEEPERAIEIEQAEQGEEPAEPRIAR